MDHSWLPSLSPKNIDQGWMYCLLLVLLAISSKYLYVGKKLRLPPAPPSKPIIGHLHLLGDLPHVNLCRLAKQYGSLMYLQLGFVGTLVVSSSQMASALFKTHDEMFANRPQTSAGKYISYDYSDIGWAQYGPYWRQLRRLCSTELFGAKRLELFRSVREDEATSMIKIILGFSLERKPVDVIVKISSFASNIISHMVMNERYFGEGEDGNLDDKEFKEIIEEMFTLFGVFNIGDFLPFLKWLDLQGYQSRMKKVRKRMDNHLDAILQKHRKRRERSTNAEPVDFVDVLLSAAEKDFSPDLRLTDGGIKAIMLDMFAAGSDTSSVTVEWALAELLKNPNVMQKAQDELDLVVGSDRQVLESDIPELSYLQAIIKETMRLHPAAPLLVPHESAVECQVGGYDIPAKTRLFVNAWAIGRDDAEWADASKFDPERFVGTDIDARGQHFNLIPFGSGRRICPGMSLGLRMIHLAFARLIHAFEWSFPSPLNPQELDMSEKFGLTVTRAQPLLLIAKPRLPMHVY
eukprot:c28737_g1_i1 orf=350-1909(-)